MGRLSWLLSPTVSMLETSNHEITPGKLAAVVNVVRSIHNVCRKTFYNSRTCSTMHWSVQTVYWSVQTVHWSVQTVYWSVQTVYWSVQTVYWSVQTVSLTHSKLALWIFLPSVERTVVPKLLNFIGPIVPEIPVRERMQSASFSSHSLLSYPPPSSLHLPPLLSSLLSPISCNKYSLLCNFVGHSSSLEQFLLLCNRLHGAHLQVYTRRSRVKYPKVHG